MSMTLGEFLEYLYEKYVWLRDFIICWLRNLWYGKESDSDNEGYSSDDDESRLHTNYGSLNSRINVRDMARIIHEFPLEDVCIISETHPEISYAESCNGSDDTIPLINDVLSPITVASDTDDIESSFEIVNRE